MAEAMVVFEHPDVSAAISQAQFPGAAFLIVETMAGEAAQPVLGRTTYVIVDTLQSTFSLNLNLNQYMTGHIFDERGELKWQKTGTTFRMVYIGSGLDTQQLPASVKILESPRHLSNFTDKTVYLWGEKVAPDRLQSEMDLPPQDNIFVELQIPQYLRYPVKNVPDRGRVCIVVREFYDDAGQLLYYRFVTMKQ